MIPLELKADNFTNCNCAYGCPCQFNALPTYGNCEAVVAMEIKYGFFDNIRLDGLKTVSVIQWPGPIHEGSGRAFIIIDESATDEQRHALLTILSGEETSPGATIWNVFAATLDTVYDPVFHKIDLSIDIPARRCQTNVKDLVTLTGEPIKNPVTGQEHRAQIHIPDGFEYSIAEMGSGSSKSTGPIELNLNNSYGQFSEYHLNNDGIVKKDNIEIA